MDFTITFKPTYEDYKQFNRVIHNKLGHRRIKIAVECLILLVINAYLFWAKFYVFATIYLLVCALVIALALVKADRNVKKAWDTNASLRENETQFRFTENGIEVTSSNGSAHVDYDKLYKLIETKTHFYLLTASNMGSGFPKDLCTPEQQAFIRERCSK